MFYENRILQQVAGTVVNIIRSIPFIILLVVLIPLTKLILGTSMGPTAASVSLTFAAIPFYARLVETSLREIDRGVIEAAESCGASPWLIIKDVLLPEAKPGMISGLTVTIISLLSYSAMAGIVGGGGIRRPCDSFRVLPFPKRRDVDYRDHFNHYRPTDSILRRPSSKSSEQKIIPWEEIHNERYNRNILFIRMGTS